MNHEFMPYTETHTKANVSTCAHTQTDTADIDYISPMLIENRNKEKNASKFLTVCLGLFGVIK